MFRVLLIGLFLVAGTSGYIWYAAPGAKPQAPPAPLVIAVLAAPAARQDVPILLPGIGTVQALNTVQIKSRVDGALDSVGFQEGQRVTKGEVLARIDPRIYQAALAQAKAKLAQDEAQLATDLKDLERSQRLISQQFASQQSVDQLTAKVAVDRAAGEADKAQIAAAQTNLDYTAIVAPFDGLAGFRNIDPGNIVHAADATAIVTLTQHEPIYVVFTLPEAQFSAVRDGMARGDLSVMAMDQTGKNVAARGVLKVTDNQIDQASGTIRLKAEFPNADDALWPGQFTPVQVQVQLQKDAITIPTASIQHGPNGIFVWVATPDQHAAMQPVATGASYGDLTIASKGVNEGDLVVTSNQYRLQPGVLLKIDTPPQPIASNAGAGRS